MKEDDEIQPVEIYAGTIWQVEMVKSLLENAEIEVFLKDEINGTMVPWITSSGGFGSIKVIVSSNDYEKAKQIVDEYESNLNSESDNYEINEKDES
jgi:hypothetical protein